LQPLIVESWLKGPVVVTSGTKLAPLWVVPPETPCP
jgi:hypothetical protein